MPSMLRLLQRLVAREGLMRRATPLLAGWNPWLPEVRRNPYPAYARLRERRVVRAPLLGAWVVARHGDAEHVLREKGFSTDRQNLGAMKAMRRGLRDAPDLRDFIDHDLLMLDGERHTRLRRLVSKAFTPRRVEALRPRIETLVEEMLEQAAVRGEGRIELIRDLAAPLPATVIGEMLGVPQDDMDQLHVWSDALAELLDPLSGRDGLEPPKQASAGLARYFRELLAERRRAPRDDLLSAMVAAEEAGEHLQEAEVLALAALLLAAGHETTTNLIGNAVLCLLRHPGERKRLVDDPGLMPSAVEEFLRFESPIQFTDRVASADTEIGGRHIRQGQLVAVLLGSANRDPTRFADPERLDLAREDNRHLAFGHGAHFCLGAQLARLEAQAALGFLLRRFPDFRGPVEPEGWKRSAILRGPTALPLELGPPA